MQNVNLYLPEFRKKKHWLDAEKMVLVAGAGIALLIVATVIEYVQLAQLRSDLAFTNQQHAQMVAATAQLLGEYGVQTEDPALLESIEALQEDLQSKQALLQFLEGRELGNAEGFSEHLSDLARYHVQGLALTEFALTDGGSSVELGGQVLKADLVLLYLQNLSKGATYAGTNFETLQISDVPISTSGTDESAPEQLVVWNFHVRSLKH